ncbi:MAG: hypothetical protein JXA33_13045 [Anaerolineae bacterium]|nr:hypothetical protein [Anaerolineae bacterium]
MTREPRITNYELRITDEGGETSAVHSSSFILYPPFFMLLTLYLLVGLAYIWVTPMMEKHDEAGHYGYLRYLHEHRQLPPLNTDDEWLIEAKQPPLYYVITAVLTAWLPDIEDDALSGNGGLLAKNIYLDYSVPGQRNDNRNVYLHPPYLTPRFIGARAISLICGLLTMVTAYLIATILFPTQTALPLTVAAAVGFQPKFIYIATAINNDAATALLGALVTLLLVYRLKSETGRLKGLFHFKAETGSSRLENLPHFSLIMGVLLGIASLTKVSALVFFPLVGLGLLLIHKGFSRNLFREGFIILGIALLVGGWWYARNALLYADPFTLGTHTGGSTTVRAFWERIGHDLIAIEHNFWANPARSFISELPIDKLLIGWGRVSLGLFIVSLLRNFKFPINMHNGKDGKSMIWKSRLHSVFFHQDISTWIILLSWPVTYFLLLVFYWNRQFKWPFGRLLFPALTPISLVFVLGWWLMTPPRWRRTVLTANTAFILTLTGLIPFISIAPLYHPWTDATGQTYLTDVSLHTVYRDPATDTPIAELIGSQLPDPVAVPGDYTRVDLCWKVLAQTSQPYAVFVHVLDIASAYTGNAPQIWGSRRTYPGLGNLPTDRWPVGKMFCDPIWVPVSTGAPTPIGTLFEVGFIDPTTGQRLESITPDGEPVGLLAIRGTSLITAPHHPLTTPPQATFDTALELHSLSYILAGNTLTLTLTWQTQAPVAYDATLFVHLTNAEGEVIAQVDRRPLDGRFPTSYWIPGHAITDTFSLSLDDNARSQLAALRLGLYTWPSLERLIVTEVNGEQPIDRALTIFLNVEN